MSEEEKLPEIEIEITDEPKKSDDVIVEAADKEPRRGKKAEINTDQAFEELHKRLEREQRAREEAEHRARLAAAHAERAERETQQTNYTLVESAIETLKREKEIVKQELAAAHAQGDFDRVAELQEDLAKHTADLANLNRGKKDMKREVEERAAAPIQTMPTRQGDPIDEIAAAVTPRSAAWINANRENLNNDVKIRKMFRAHEDAVEDGIQPDSDEYFQYIENRLGLGDNMSNNQSSRRASPPAAPVSRGGNGTGSRPNVVRLTAEQREMAQLMGMTDKEYALNLLELQKEGKLTQH